jgi:hypothetical protein
MSTNFKAVVAATPVVDDVNQYADTLSGVNDAGSIALAGPTTAPASAGTATATTGTALGIGVYVYAMTYVTGIRRGAGYVVTAETIASPTWTATTTTGNQAVSHTSLPTTSATQVVAKRLYRTTVGGAQRKLVVELAPGATTYTDTTTDASLGVNEPTVNTTGTTFALSTKNDLTLQDVLFWMSI